MAETAILDDLLRHRESPDAARDRLALALAVAAAVHLALILGVTFTRGHSRATRGNPTLEVLLLHTDKPDTDDNPNAAYLAEQNRTGAGHRTDSVTAAAAESDPAEQPSDLEAAPEGAQKDLYDEMVTSTNGAPTTAAGDRNADPRPSPLPVFNALPAGPALGMDPGGANLLRGHPNPKNVDAPDTRASDVAVYLDAWRHKIERIGTANYPLAALRRTHLSGNPVLEVQILADGRLGQVLVQRSSGHPELDQAALEILRLAAPFDPFPPALALQHQTLRLAYEWEFLGGELRDSRTRLGSDSL